MRDTVEQVFDGLPIGPPGEPFLALIGRGSRVKHHELTGVPMLLSISLDLVSAMVASSGIQNSQCIHCSCVAEAVNLGAA